MTCWPMAGLPACRTEGGDAVRHHDRAPNAPKPSSRPNAQTAGTVTSHLTPASNGQPASLGP